MTAKVLDGKATAAAIKKELRGRVAALAERGHTPGLGTLLVGEDAGSQKYVAGKHRDCAEVGIESIQRELPADATEEQILDVVRELNEDPACTGYIVQLPLPQGLDDKAVIAAIDPAKDVDGFNVANAGALATGQDALVPCTPLGAIMLLKDRLGSLAGKDAVVVGRSNIVGKPMAQLLLAEDATVTIAHSRTQNLPEIVRRADIVIAAVGRPEMIRGDWIKPGATVIDVGINRIDCADQGDGKTSKLVGDVAYAEASDVAGAITPVPGGVGPMTIAVLLRNTLVAAFRRAGVAAPEGL